MHRTIWIIDDDLVSQFATRYCIEQYGKGNFQIHTFVNAEEGLDRLKQLNQQDEPFPNLIFLDLVMDEMNGWQFIEAMRKHFKTVEFPEIYVLSAFKLSKDRAIAKTHKHVAGYFDKPLSRVSLNKVFNRDSISNP